VTYALAAVLGYLLGAVSPATLYARRAGADLRSSGSGNPGATNAGRLLGRRVGITVALLDVAKGFVPALVFGLAVSHRAGLVAGLAAVLGHVTSPYLRGHGGKGVATAAGAVLGSHPLWAPLVLLAWVAVVLLTKWVALGSVCAALALVVTSCVARAPGFDIGWAVAVALVVLARHRRNFLSTDRRRRPHAGTPGA
jgi:glycerol-3-phosphate acyltransferase PlsY